MHKKWTIVTLISTGIILCLIAAFVIVIDPFFNYHTPIRDYGYYLNNESYQNPGLARHFTYDAVLVGSSMVENFDASELDQMFGVNTIKLPYSGASFYNIKLISDIAFRHSDVKTVFWGVDLTRLSSDPNEPRYPLPEYLYTSQKIDDIEYIFNQDVIAQTVSTIRRMHAKIPNTPLDTAYEWYSQHKNDFNAKAVAQEYLSTRGDIGEDEEIDIANDEEIDMTNVELNIQQNILPLIEENPDTTFIMFFPPYSVLYWDTIHSQGLLDDYMRLKELVIEALMKYDNVALYDFQADASIICDITNYKDYSHYHPDINSYMVTSMAEGRYLLTKQNYKQEINKLHDLVLQIDVPALLQKYIDEAE